MRLKVCIASVYLVPVYICLNRLLIYCITSLVSKTEEEIQEILQRKEAQLKEKEGRRKKQEENVAQKKQKQEENKYVHSLLPRMMYSFCVPHNFQLN